MAADPGYAPRAVFAAAVGYGLDGFDLLILSFALSGIVATFSISDTAAGGLATITLLGAVCGGILFGSLADRYGRVRVLTWTVVLFAAFSGLSALAQGYWDLAAYRFIAGAGIGGEFGIGMTLAAEAVPASWRARATSWVAVGFQLGVLGAALVSAPIIEHFGWRGLFAVGALPAAAAFFIRRRLGETPKFIAARAAETQAVETWGGTATPPWGSISGLFANAATMRITLAMMVLTTVQNAGYFGIMTWLPTYLSTVIGLSINKSSLWTAVTVSGMILGILIFGQLADRIGRRHAFWIFQTGAACSVLAYSQITDPAALLLGGFVMGAFANGMLGGYGALIAELYPTEVRATAQNVLFNIGRGLGGFAPMVIAAVAATHGFSFALALLPIIYLVQFAAMFVLPERRGAELE